MAFLIALLVTASVVASAAPVSSGDELRLRCLKALAPIEAGNVPASEQFEPVACTSDSHDSAFRRDPEIGFSRTLRALAAGDVVARFSEYGVDMVRPGQMLQIIVVVGPVRIVRQVQAVQGARPGQRLFVQSADGQVLSTRYEASAP